MRSRDWSVWSVECRLVVTDPASYDEAVALVDRELDAIERACSRFRPDSELRRLPSGGGPVSPLLATLLGVALTAARDTDGAVDPTVGSAMVGLGYDRDLSLVRRTGSAVSVVRRPPGWRSVRLLGDRVETAPGTQLDLGATAKAHAADRCARLVHQRLGTGVLVSLGGDIATAGPGPEDGWQVTVQDLPEDTPARVTLAPGAAMATSSTVRRTWVQGDQVRHHLLDPATGLPARTPWRTATVVAPTCVRANVASTAALVKGSTGLAWLSTSGLPARLVPRHGGPVTLGGWPREGLAA